MAESVNASIIYSQPENISSPPDFFFTYLNTQSNGAWSMVLLGLSFGIPFMALMNYNAREAFAAASFNFLVTAILLSVFGIVGSFMYTLATVMVGLGVILNR